jgi:hypothetical protein
MKEEKSRQLSLVRKRNGLIINFHWRVNNICSQMKKNAPRHKAPARSLATGSGNQRDEWGIIRKGNAITALPE